MVLLLAAVTVADGVAATSGAGSDLVGQLAGLAELHRTGDLAADEFVLAKQRVLAVSASVSDVVAAAPPPPPPHGADRYDVVADFGAKGDGVADDTKSLQAGIDAVSAATRRFLILFCVCVCVCGCCTTAGFLTGRAHCTVGRAGSARGHGVLHPSRHLSHHGAATCRQLVWDRELAQNRERLGHYPRQRAAWRQPAAASAGSNGERGERNNGYGKESIIMFLKFLVYILQTKTGTCPDDRLGTNMQRKKLRRGSFRIMSHSEPPHHGPAAA